MAAIAREGVGRVGEGRIVVASRAGESRVLSAYARTPLQLLVPRAAGASVWAFTSNHGGGLVDGDELSLDLDVGERACALVTTQATTKVYRAREGGAGAVQTIEARVGEGAFLALVPDAVSCFANARFRQRTRVDVAVGGALVLVEALVSGRVGAGERWAFASYDSRMDVSFAGAPIVAERVRLDPEDGPIAPRMGRFEAFATVIVAGDALAAIAGDLVEALDARKPAPRDTLHVAASPLGAGGAIVRLAADGAETLSKHLRSMLSFLPRFLGDDPLARKS